MKKARIGALVLAGILLAAASAAPAKAADVSFDFFYSNLSSHGSWMVSGSYGNVWQPRNYNAEWNPYYDGQWEYTDCGWTWVSDYDWGGIPYHYGTWVRDPRIGWVWVPGYVWGPSWVVFRSDADYVGWAPVPPDFTIGASFSSYSIDPSFYVFVPSRSFASGRVRTVIVPRTQINVIVNKTKIINNNITIQNNIVVNRGPDVRMIEQRSGRRIQQVPIERVRNISATGTVTRDQIRVDPARARGRRVAEPVREPIEQARANSRVGREDRSGNTAGRAADRADRNDQSGRGRRARENTSTAPAASSTTENRDQTRDPRGRERRNRPDETTTTAPSTQRPDESRDARERNRRNRPESTSEPDTDQQGRARRTRERNEPEASTAPQDPAPQRRARTRRDGTSDRTPPPPENPPRVRPNEPQPDPDGTSARQPDRTQPRQKAKSTDTKGKKKAKPPEPTEEPK